MFEYGLIGKNINYSFSPFIHFLFGNKNYQILNLNEEELISFLQKKQFKGINVTIPYKNKVIKYLDYVDEKVKLTNSCNVIINKNNKLYGYNFDYDGLFETIKDLDFSNQNIAILGSGATSKTAFNLCLSLNAKNIYIISRGKSNYNYQDLDNLKIDYIINTTPVGNLNNNELICKINKDIKGVIDVNYNPLLSKLLLEAKENNIIYRNGLKMLVYQAYLTHIHFFDLQFDYNYFKKVYEKIKFLKTNIYLIGMPYNGKSLIGKELSLKLSKNFYDLDEEIIKEENLNINDIFKIKGEEYFRNKEKEILEKLVKKENCIISLGGGAILNEENRINLLQTGIIYLIKRDSSLIKFNDSRPLCNDINKYNALLKRREKLYNSIANKVFYNDHNYYDVVKEMEVDFNEIISS